VEAGVVVVGVVADVVLEAVASPVAVAAGVVVVVAAPAAGAAGAACELDVVVGLVAAGVVIAGALISLSPLLARRKTKRPAPPLPAEGRACG
jgi:hypothetical protein